jgi:hypothetical protein
MRKPLTALLPANADQKTVTLVTLTEASTRFDAYRRFLLLSSLTKEGALEWWADQLAGGEDLPLADHVSFLLTENPWLHADDEHGEAAFTALGERCGWL